jgi:hypothetical protein
VFRHGFEKNVEHCVYVLLSYRIGYPSLEASEQELTTLGAFTIPLTNFFES